MLLKQPKSSILLYKKMLTAWIFLDGLCLWTYYSFKVICYNCKDSWHVVFSVKITPIQFQNSAYINLKQFEFVDLIFHVFNIFFAKRSINAMYTPHSKLSSIYHMPYHVKKYTIAIRSIFRCIWVKWKPEANKPARFLD